jgi:DNA (cytosine-5)-methyltransferase 3A
MINVLSLFDGISCGQIALSRLGIEVDNYYASEIDKHAIKVTQHNFPNTIQLGDVSSINADMLPNIGLLFGGSPCTGFSIAGKQLNFEDPQSKLFFEFVRVLNEVKPKYFLLENVKMKKEYMDIISEHLGVEPIEINSGLVSAQNRRRLYWTNIPGVEQPEDKGILIKDILDKNVTDGVKINFDENGISKFKATNKKYVILNDKDIPPYSIYETRTEEGRKERKRIRQLTGIDTTPRGSIHKEYRFNKKYKSNCLVTVQSELNKVIDQDYNYRYYTNREYCRLQTVSDTYFDGTDTSDNQIRKMLGNGWTVDVISHIFSYM